MNLETELRRFGVVPVIALDRVEDALPLVDALAEGGLPIAEITFRTSAAASSIAAVRAARSEIRVGAGTILTTAQADAAVTAGAAFLVSPGLNPAVVDYAIARGIPMIPGVATPSEVEQALTRDLALVKLFPAGPIGGIPYLKALTGPYPSVRYVPTGGVTQDNLADWLAMPQVAACGGSWLTKADLIRAGDFAAIRGLAEAASTTVRRVRGEHERRAVR